MDLVYQPLAEWYLREDRRQREAMEALGRPRWGICPPRLLTSRGPLCPSRGRQGVPHCLLIAGFRLKAPERDFQTLSALMRRGTLRNIAGHPLLAIITTSFFG